MKLIGTNISYMTLFGSEKCRYSTTTHNKECVEGKLRILETNYTTIFLCYTISWVESLCYNGKFFLAHVVTFSSIFVHREPCPEEGYSSVFNIQQ